jgi:adenosylcobinamide kinase/adenosylcobinamide-phosphate guanylyltransferase
MIFPGRRPRTLDFSALEIALHEQVDALIAACQQASAPIFIVTNELGMSITPENRLARHFVDISGRVNQNWRERHRTCGWWYRGLE